MDREIYTNLGSYNPDGDWITWECPECGETHGDPEYTETHCRKCGLSVLAIDGVAFSNGWYVKLHAT